MAGYDSYKDSGVKWIGQIPSHWNIIRSKFLWQEVNSVSKSGTEELLSVSQYDGVIPSKEESRSESLKGYKIVSENSLVINIMLAWLGGLGVSKYNGIVSPAYCVYELKKEANPRFLHYLYKTPMYLAEFARHSTGVVPSRWRMYTDDFGRVLSLLPPLDEQTAIAEYLDKETAKIDTAIAQQQKMIDLLKERKQIIINSAVTRGLDKNLKMKDSGVEWIGEVPEHWEVVKLKYAVNLVTTKSTLPNKIGLENIESGTGVLIETLSEFEGNGIEFIEGDILYGKLRPYLKKVYVAKNQGNAVGDFFVLRPKTNTLSVYLQYLLLSQQMTDTINSSTYGTKMPRVSYDYMGGLFIPYPSTKEQKVIILGVKKMIKPIDNAIVYYKKQITLLQERKQILINEVVTGKIKIL